MGTTTEFQSTPPCGGRHDGIQRAPRRREEVSIHAPVRGATLQPRRRDRRIVVSIHAPVRGATHVADHAAALGHVSIHAPVRGATNGRTSAGGGSYVFQSTPPCGGRPWKEKSRRPLEFEFQSTPPCGGRRRAASGGSPRRCFNPRPRAGGDRGHVTILVITRKRAVCANVRRSGVPVESPHEKSGAQGGQSLCNWVANVLADACAL